MVKWFVVIKEYIKKLLYYVEMFGLIKFILVFIEEIELINEDIDIVGDGS